MAKHRKPGNGNSPRRTAYRIDARLVAQLKLLAERNLTDITSEVQRAVREYLERERLWPPDDDTGGPPD